MNRLRQSAREVWERGEDQMHKHWPVWVMALALYAVAAFMMVTRARIPSMLHLVVFIMAAAVLSVTSLRIEWGMLALALILPFARPGITVGNPPVFNISGFNVALAGVFVAYILRYAADAQFASKGPLFRRTRLDGNLMAFGFLLLLSSLWSFRLNTSPAIILGTLVYLKEQALYFIWFYMLVTLIRTPKDLRQFAMCLAIAGMMASFAGLGTRLMGGAEAMTPATMEENLEEGAGGRVGGGWLGLGHSNMFAALLLMTMPMWFFAVSHLKHGIRRLAAEAAVITAFIGLLFTYSRSAWIGASLGIGLIGLADRKALKRVILFGLVFAIAAQTVVLFTIHTNLVEIIVNRFEQLESSTFSSRPYIYASAIQVIKKYPMMGTGLGAFPYHAPATPMGWVPGHSHNVYLAYATEAGLPAAFLFVILTVRVLALSIRNLRRVGRLPGYGFIALGSSAALIGLTVQSMAVQVFHYRLLGFGFYALVAIVVSIDRMIANGQLTEEAVAAEESASQGGIWVRP